MLSKLEKIRKDVGRESISSDGVVITSKELYELFKDCSKEFEDNYNLRGHVRALNTVFDIPDSTITGVNCDWYDYSIRIERKDTQGHYLNDMTLCTKEYEKAYIKVFYSEFDWIDVHIRLSENDYSTSISLCFPPKR